MSNNVIIRGFRFAGRQFRHLFGRKGISGERITIRNQGRLINVTFDIQGSDHLIEIMEDVALSNITIYMRGHHHHLKIGNDVKVGGGSFWLEDDHGAIIIESKTTIESAHLAVTEPCKKILIGEDCMLATNIEIRTGDSHSIIDASTGKRLNPPADVILERHVWIGANAVILKGVTIGANSIIATNSVVTHDIPPASVAAGQPAKVIRNGVSWLRERINEY